MATTSYDLDQANGRLPDVRPLLELLRDQRADLVSLRDALVAARAEEPEGAGTLDDDRVRLLEARITALVDQMQASVARIDGWGIALRDIETGLIDFPAQAGDRQIWLCWRLGEDVIRWWHEIDTGIAGRRPVEEMA